ncbi:27 kDa hemolymph protein-like isoform X2 [Zophobas morio]|uniref:27 kDa hemolymph protein-like isoform X2 n=1 Tax=Zophobas morio TaxID=2755281 RepID=UPI003082CAD6
MSIKRNMYVIFVVALLIGGTFSTSSLNFNLDLDLNNEFTNSKDELETFINDKCNENGANTTFSFLMNTTFELNMCTQTHFNIAEVQHELNIARTNGTMDEVVLKYCLRYPQIDKCLRKGYDAVKTCLNSTEQAIVQESLKFAGDLIKQMCLKDGTRLAMFIGYEGVECLNVQKEHLQECVMDSVGNNTEYVVILHQLFVSNDDNQRCRSRGFGLVSMNN